MPEIPEIEKYLVEDEENDLLIQGNENVAIDHEPLAETEIPEENDTVNEVNVGEENVEKVKMKSIVKVNQMKRMCIHF